MAVLLPLDLVGSVVRGLCVYGGTDCCRAHSFTKKFYNTSFVIMTCETMICRKWLRLCNDYLVLEATLSCSRIRFMRIKYRVESSYTWLHWTVCLLYCQQQKNVSCLWSHAAAGYTNTNRLLFSSAHKVSNLANIFKDHDAGPELQDNSLLDVWDRLTAPYSSIYMGKHCF